MDTKIINLEELQNLFALTLEDMDDLEIFCYCTGTCVTLRCLTGNN